MTYFLTTQKFDPLLHINLENIKVRQISFLNVAMFKSAQVPWTYFLRLSDNINLFCFDTFYFRRISRQKSQRDREEEELKRQLSAPDKLIEDEEIEEGSVSNLSSAAALVN